MKEKVVLDNKVSKKNEVIQFNEELNCIIALGPIGNFNMTNLRQKKNNIKD